MPSYRRKASDVTLREKSSVICVGPCVTVAELACRSGAVRRAADELYLMPPHTSITY